jgi:hypothetical protein
VFSKLKTSKMEESGPNDIVNMKSEETSLEENTAMSVPSNPSLIQPVSVRLAGTVLAENNIFTGTWNYVPVEVVGPPFPFEYKVSTKKQCLR